MSAEPTLLVIDDEPGVLAIVDRFAQRFGFKVVSRADAHAAVAKLPVLKPDAVIVDLMMPDINGLDVLRAIRDIDPTCQIILMTAHASVDTAIEAVRLEPSTTGARRRLITECDWTESTNTPFERFRRLGKAYRQVEHGSR